MTEFILNYFSQAPSFGWNSFWVSQGLICIALFFDLGSWQFKSRGHILIMIAIANSLISAHLFLLDQIVAGILVSIGALRFLTSYFSTHHYFLYGFIGLAFGNTLIFYQIPLDLLALACSTIFAVASFQKNDKRLRLFMMAGSSLWITYQLLIFSPAAAILSSLFLVSNFLGYYRYYLK